MKVLLVLAHPSEESFVSFLSSEVSTELKSGGHEVRYHDLWTENFSPVFTPYERLNHVGDVAEKLKELPELQQHMKICSGVMRWCLCTPRGGQGNPQS